MSSPIVSTVQPGIGGHEHCEIRLAAGRGEGAGDVVHRARRGRQLEDQHVLGEPALLVRHDRGDAQREALLAEQGIAAVAGAERPDLARLREVRDRLGRVAGPGHIVLAGLERSAERVHAGDELAVVAQLGERLCAHAGHHAHGDRDVGRVGQLYADVRDRRVDRAHRERHHVERAPAHRAREERAQLAAHHVRVAPVVGRPGILAASAADEGPVLDARDIARIGARQIRVRPQLVVEPGEGARGDELAAQQLVLLVGAVAPVHALGLEQDSPVLDPRTQPGVVGRCGCCGHEVDARHAHPPCRVAIR